MGRWVVPKIEDDFLPYTTKEDVDHRRLKVVSWTLIGNDANGHPEYFEEFHSESAEPERIPNPEYQPSVVVPGVHYRDVQYATPEPPKTEEHEGNANLLAFWLVVIGLSIGVLAVFIQSIINVTQMTN